ncbi:MAG: hypothetical protein M1819_000238 [Sarea resinae]|nr:MAG: hypothetical protein M1819_000238 [Sarea resinae]
MSVAVGPEASDASRLALDGGPLSFNNPQVKLANENHLVVSPYTEGPHLLDLESYSQPVKLLAKALTVLSPVRPDYATASYVESFNWDQVVETLRQAAANDDFQWEKQSFYVVAFRSRIPRTTNYEDLARLDLEAHMEATKSGGLLKYWFGLPDADGRNLATCVWREREDARRGGTGEGHQRAMRATRGLYAEWALERFRFTIEDGALQWEMIDWTD